MRKLTEKAGDISRLMDLSEKILIQRFIHHKQAQLNLSELSKGLYLLEIVDDGGHSEVYKVVRE